MLPKWQYFVAYKSVFFPILNQAVPNQVIVNNFCIFKYDKSNGTKKYNDLLLRRMPYVADTISTPYVIAV